MRENIVGRRISLLLKEKGLTQRELAMRAGATESAISKYISGDREPRAEILADIATVLGTTVSYLLGKEEEKIETQYGTICDLCARHAHQMSPEEKNHLIQIIVGASQR